MTCPRLAIAIVLLTCADSAAQNQPPSPRSQTTQPSAAATQSTKKEPSVYDPIWRFAEWYEDTSNPVVQRVLFTGRFHEDYATIDSDEGNHSEWNVRRLRLGPRITFLKTFLFHAEVELNPQERDPFYVRFTDLYVQWSRNPRLALAVGKQAMPFTQEGATSSKELLTIDRSNLANNLWFPQEYLPGVSASGKRAAWNYRLGLHSSGASNRELGEFNGGVSALAIVGYDLAQKLGVKEALLSGNYVYQTADANNTFTRQLDHVFSANLRMDAGGWGIRGDLSAASGYLGQSNLWGLMAMPFVNLTDTFQVVARYTHLGSSHPNGIRLATYENTVVPGRGDQFNELYAGANYYFYGHKLKLQTGLQLADMNDSANDGGEYSGVSWVTGLRIGW